MTNSSNEVDLKVIGAGDVIRKARKQSRFKNQEEFAKRSKMSTSALSRYESNDRPLTWETISKVAKTANVDANKLLYDCIVAANPGKSNSEFFRLMKELLETMQTQR